MSETRLIKKYPNRRLYDTSSSTYITLEHVRQMVVDGIPFSVVQQKTGDDITRNILMQIILEQETDGEPKFNVDTLLKFIQNYGTDTQQLFSDCMEQSMNFLPSNNPPSASNLSTASKAPPWNSGQNWVRAN